MKLLTQINFPASPLTSLSNSLLILKRAFSANLANSVPQKTLQHVRCRLSPKWICKRPVGQLWARWLILKSLKVLYWDGARSLWRILKNEGFKDHKHQSLPEMLRTRESQWHRQIIWTLFNHFLKLKEASAKAKLEWIQILCVAQSQVVYQQAKYPPQVSQEANPHPEFPTLLAAKWIWWSFPQRFRTCTTTWEIR